MRFNIFMGLAAVVCGMCFWSAPARAQEAVPADCVRDVEHWMREYQARHVFVTGNGDPDAGSYVKWPACCPGEQAPHFPPDNYYDSAVENNPDLAVELVQSLQDAFCGYADYSSFLVNDNPSDAAWNDGSIRQTFQQSDFPDLCQSSNPVTLSSMCEVLSALREAIGRLQTVSRPVSFEDCFERSGSSLDYYADLDCTEAYGDAAAMLDYTWSIDSWEGVSSCVYLGVEDHGSQGFDDNEPPLCFWYVSYSAVVGRVRVTGIEHYPGQGVLYIAPQRACVNNTLQGGYGPPATANGRYHNLTSFGGNAPFVTDTIGPYGLSPAHTWTAQNPPPDLPLCEEVDPNDIEAFVDCVCGDHIAFSGQQSKAGWELFVGNTLAAFRPDWQTQPDSSRKCGEECSSCADGTPSAALDPANVYFPLGKMTDGTSAGTLQIRASELVESLASPSSLIANVPAAVEIVPNSTEEPPVQFQGDYVVAEVGPPAVGETGYSLRFYHKADLSYDNPSHLFVTSGETPFTIATVEVESVLVPDPLNSAETIRSGMLVVETTGVGAKRFVFTQLGEEWSLAY